MLEHYRRDRNKLLEFILTSPNLIKQVRTPSGPASSLSDINLDTLSADYVLSCINSGGYLLLSLGFLCFNFGWFLLGLFSSQFLFWVILFFAGGVVDVSEATSSYYRELAYPAMVKRSLLFMGLGLCSFASF